MAGKREDFFHRGDRVSGEKRGMGGRKKYPMHPRNIIRFQLPKDAKIEYKNLALLQRFLTDRGKIVSQRASSVSAAQQRQLAAAIKLARFLALLSTGGLKK